MEMSWVVNEMVAVAVICSDRSVGKRSIAVGSSDGSLPSGDALMIYFSALGIADTWIQGGRCL